jgi:hypothetical protein
MKNIPKLNVMRLNMQRVLLCQDRHLLNRFNLIDFYFNI